jgi:D-glycero-D-manno-heptose 1,7-bisphosphate phosphatase
MSVEAQQGRRRAVFLDRDGVIIATEVRGGRPYAIRDVDSLEILPDAPAALAALRNAGYLNIVATNQPDVVRGAVSRAAVEAMHQCLMSKLPIDDIKVCYEVDGPSATCYKPQPTMLLEAARQYDIDVSRSYMVGDRWRDVGAGRAAGCFTIFVDRGYTEQRPDRPDAVVGSLGEAADMILQRSGNISEGAES